MSSRDLVGAGWPLSHHLLQQVPWRAPANLTLTDPTRVAFAGCWHARADLAVPALRAAAESGATVVVHTGDFLYAEPQAAQMVAIVEAEAHALGLMVLVVRGNHDDPGIFTKAAARRQRYPDGFARLSPRVLHAPDGHRWSWSGVAFAALGGAASVDRAMRTEGASWWPRETSSPRARSALMRGPRADVLVTHDVPAGVELDLPTAPVWWDLESAEAHRERLADVVAALAPSWVVSGHMHLRASRYLPIAGTLPARVEVLDRVESGVAGNLWLADLADAIMTAAPASSQPL